MATRRRRSRNSYLENLGGLSRSTMLIFGLATLLLLASIGIVGATLARRSGAEQAQNDGGPTPTAFVALVETPVSTLPTPIVIPTPRSTATARSATSPTAKPTVRVTRTVPAAALGAGQGAGARGLAGSMAIVLGGTLPPAEVAAAPAPTQPIPAQPVPTQPRAAVQPVPTPAPRTSGSTGGGSVPSGGGTSSGSGSSSGGGSVYTPPTGSGSSSGGGTVYTPPTPTPYVAPPLPPTPTVNAPPMVAPTPTPVPLPAAILPGPGSRTYSYQLTYTQNADLAALPDSDFAYITTYKTYTAGDAATLKAALGLTGQVEQTGDGFRITGPGTLIISNTAGSLTYTAATGASEPTLNALALPTRPAITPAVEAPATPHPATAPASTAPSPSATPSRPAGTPTIGGTPTAPQLSDEAALAAAKKILTGYGLLPADADAGRVTRPLADQVVVTFHPAQPGSLIPQDPMARVTLAADGALRGFYERWPTNLTARPALLRDPQIAWAEATNGGGYLEVDQTIPSDLPANTVFHGAATVTKVGIGWAPGTTGTATYLVPLYVFEGTVTLTNPPTGQPKTVPFRIYIAATQQQ